jgi:hypothetical protein
VLVESPDRRAAVSSSFVRANAKALECYGGEQRAQYVRLKLEGLDDAPGRAKAATGGRLWEGEQSERGFDPLY